MEKGEIERGLIAQGLRLAGVDEVGRGCLAGPVYAATVALDYDGLISLDPNLLSLIRDSKTLSSKQRQKILPTIENICISKGIGFATAREIESNGIVNATFLAMARSFECLSPSVDYLLIDGNQTNPFIECAQKSIVGGDSFCFAIAAASILAKEARDAFMRQAAFEFPPYAFGENVGYGTKSHLKALAEYGITPLHRRNFAPVARRLEQHESESDVRP